MPESERSGRKKLGHGQRLNRQGQSVDTASDDLPLFHGPHIPRIRFEQALDRLDLRAAIAPAPQPWQTAVEGLAAVLDQAGGRAARVPVEALAACRRDGWPASLERTWQRLMGLSLDGRGVPGTYAGELAAAFLLRGGERGRGRASAQRHLHYHPRDARAWELLALFEPMRAAARCGFHGGPLLEAAGALIDLVEDDGMVPIECWLLVYAWFGHHIDLDEIRDALDASTCWRARRSCFPVTRGRSPGICSTRVDGATSANQSA